MPVNLTLNVRVQDEVYRFYLSAGFGREYTIKVEGNSEQAGTMQGFLEDLPDEAGQESCPTPCAFTPADAGRYTWDDVGGLSRVVPEVVRVGGLEGKLEAGYGVYS